MKKRIHILGASGSGTTTLGMNICQELGYKHLDTDSFFWEPTDPEFIKERPANERIALIKAQIEKHEKWVLSGDFHGWGMEIFPYFELVIFLYIDRDLRLKRLRDRELKKYGDRTTGKR